MKPTKNITPLNCWYVAAISDEIVQDRLFGRRICDTAMVFYRDSSGSVAALRDACPHRFYPLSKGRLENGVLRCMYHGLEFGSDGKCVHIPVQDRISENARVQAFPTREMGGFVWVWPGDPLLADDAPLPGFPVGEGYKVGLDFSCLDSDGFRNTEPHYIHVDANYMLVVDNLMDLTHVSIVHENTFQTRKAHSAERDVQIHGDLVYDFFTNIGMPTGFIEREGQGIASEMVDSWLDTYWYPPSAMILCHGATPHGKIRAEGSCVLNVNIITPETETTSHYFWVQCVFAESHGDVEARVEFWREATRGAFLEDEAVLREQQKNLEGMGVADVFDVSPLIIASDRASQRVRRIVGKMVEAES